MSQMPEHYNHKNIEKKQQNKWEQDKLFYATENSEKPKYYCLSMLPYPSGKLHMGHVRNYTIGDVITRFYKLNGYNVMQPFGWDAFGLPAENAALVHKISPNDWTIQNTENMRSQLKSMGLAVDWDREIATCSPEYYRWQQWLFIQLYKKGIVYRKNGVVNWDPVDKTVLANEQVIDGRGWRSGALVEKKEIPMYYLKITQYADELLQCLDELDGWPEQVKSMQRNWIGKSLGMEIKFSCEFNFNGAYRHSKGFEEASIVTVFTTRPDTLMGVTYVAISAEHPLIDTIVNNSNDVHLKKAIAECNLGGVAEAEVATQEKKGVFTGYYVIHPITQDKLPLWVANYVLGGYGSGAVMGVPAHCDRDFEFAKKYQLPIKVVLTDGHTKTDEKCSIIGDSLINAIATEIDNKNILINSGEFDSLNYEQAFNKIGEELNKKDLGEIKTNYRLHDWGISRQRYWGCPIPIIHCENCKEVLVPEDQLPVKLPTNVVPEGVGNLLAQMPEFYTTICPQCGANAKRETDTMDTFVDSSWYYLRYASYNCDSAIFDDRVNYWLPVDQYVGGIEHAILHLLYARFFHKCLRDLGLLKTDEPFTNLLPQGMVLSNTYYREDEAGQKTWFNPNDIAVKLDAQGKILEAIYKGDNKHVRCGGMEKMSKSKNNGVDPVDIINNYGADTARLFMMFNAPVELSLEWSTNGLEGSYRFIRKLWNIVYTHINNHGSIEKYKQGVLTGEQKKLRLQLHQTIEKVTLDIAVRKQFNTAIASIMELLNNYNKTAFVGEDGPKLGQEILEAVIIMLSPMIPHVCAELWEFLVPNTSLYAQSWVQTDLSALEVNEVEIIVQVNGKLRGKMTIEKDLNEQQVMAIALKNPNVAKFINDKPLKKTIYVANKLLNIVI